MFENVLFQTESSSLRLILYQDTFEVVNPLGSGKKKHKLIAVHLTLTDLMPHDRSSTDQMQLVFWSRLGYGPSSMTLKILSSMVLPCLMEKSTRELCVPSQVTIWDHIIQEALWRTSAGVHTSADTVISAEKHSIQILLSRAQNAQWSHTVVIFRMLKDSLHIVEVLNLTLCLIRSNTSMSVSQGCLHVLAMT